MNPTGLLNWMLLSTVLLGLWWLCYRLALRQERGFAYNRVFLVLGPVLAAGLPLLPVAWPTGWGAAPAALPSVATVLLPAATIGADTTPAAEGAGWPWLVVAYAAGVLLLLARLALDLGRLWLSTRHLPREPADGYALLRTRGQLPTSSFGRLVLWDDTLPLSPAEASQVLRHELAHVRQGHTYDRLLLELLRAALWFNPFVHLCSRALALTHEYLADEAALQSEAAPFSATRSYAHLLARQVANRLGFSVPLAHTFSHSQTLRRIAMIQKTSPVRRWKQWLALPLVAASLFTVACEQRNEAVTPAPSASAQDSKPEPPPPPPAPVAPNAPPAVPQEGQVYTYVEQLPQLPGGGGTRAIVEYIQSRLDYPKLPAAERVDGTVFVQFVVDAKGVVQSTSVNIVKGLTAPYDNAVAKAVLQLPRFIPGNQAGNPVAVSFTVPIRFAKKAPANTVGWRLFNSYGGWEPKLVPTGC